MRHTKKVTLCLAAAIVFLGIAGPTSAQPEAERVRIQAICPPDGGRPEVSVRPQEVVVQQDQDIEWQLQTNNPNNNSIEVLAKDPGHWPYTESSHQGQGSAHARGMKPNARGTYGYNFRVYCGDQGYLFDPRVRVE